jgi:hypothetical protein
VIVKRTGAAIRADVTVTFDPGAPYAFRDAHPPPSLDLRPRQVG